MYAPSMNRAASAAEIAVGDDFCMPPLRCRHRAIETVTVDGHTIVRTIDICGEPQIIVLASTTQVEISHEHQPNTRGRK